MAQPPIKKGAVDSTDLALAGRVVVTDASDNLPAVDGNAVLNLNADQLLTGTVPAARLIGSYNIDITGNAATATLATDSLDAQLLDGLDSTHFTNATNLVAGTVPTARLTGTYNISISGNAATATNAANSDLLDSLDSTFFRNASNLNTGTVPDARLSSVGATGSYTNANVTVDSKGRVTAASNGAGNLGGSNPATWPVGSYALAYVDRDPAVSGAGAVVQPGGTISGSRLTYWNDYTAPAGLFYIRDPGAVSDTAFATATAFAGNTANGTLPGTWRLMSTITGGQPSWISGVAVVGLYVRIA